MLYAIVTPIIGALLVALLGKQALIRNLITINTSIILLGILFFYTIGGIDTNHSIELPIIIPHIGLVFTCSAEGLVFAFMVSSLWILANIYAIGYMIQASDAHQKRFFFFFTISISAAIGIAFSGSITTMFIFYEMLTLATYPLIVNRAKEDTIKAGRTYLHILLGSSLLLLLPSILAIYHLLGEANFTYEYKLPNFASSLTCSLILLALVYGTAKAALMPMHKWLIAAMVAQTPVSALLHAVAVVKSGLFLIIKTNFYIFGIEWVQNQHWLIWLAGASIITSSFLALKASHLKVRLAYSTVSQLSYVILFSTISENIMLPVMYMVLHAFAKISLFFAAGSISTSAHTQEITELNGLGKYMPWTMTCFAISGLAMIGLPFTGIFAGKTFLLTTAANTTTYLFITGVITLSTILNTLYFLPIIYHSFFSDSIYKCCEISLTMRVPMIVTTLLNVGSFIVFVIYSADHYFWLF